MVDTIKSWVIVVAMTGVFSGSSFADDILDVAPLEEQGAGCASVVCKNVTVAKGVNKADDFPERTGNETLSAIGNVLFIAGEIGLAENLQEDELQTSNSN